MKKLIFIMAMWAGAAWSANAQVSVQFNIGTQPVWGPSGYDYAEYYYIPDIDVYYDVAANQYVYYDGGAWAPHPYLPPQYASFDLYRAHKVVINQRQPWRYHNNHVTRYVTYKGRHDQRPIRDMHEQKYWENAHHPEHNKWNGKHWQSSGPGNGHGRGHEGHGNGHGRGHEEHGNGHGHGHDKH